MSKNIELNIVTSNTSDGVLYDTLYPKSFSNIINLSDFSISALSLNADSTLDNALNNLKSLITNLQISTQNTGNFAYGLITGTGQNQSLSVEIGFKPIATIIMIQKTSGFSGRTECYIYVKLNTDSVTAATYSTDSASSRISYQETSFTYSIDSEMKILSYIVFGVN